jgi:hypothetical protein
MVHEIRACRICGNTNLVPIVDLGIQTLTGVFPKDKNQKITSGPLELVKCLEGNDEQCGLVQLRHTYNHEEMYGDNYGYRSGLNASMVHHLNEIVKYITHKAALKPNDLIVDIGSNDATLLKSYPKKGYRLAGIDPTAVKFKEFYTVDITAIGDFFNERTFREHFGDKKAKVITSISMFYDLENPMAFVNDIYRSLDEEGIWVFEQSYLPLMIERNAYDTICHEHLEYYGMKQIDWMLKRAGFKIIDIEFNDTNGGSFRVTASKTGASYPECRTLLNEVLNKERDDQYHTLNPYKEFERRVRKHKEDILALIGRLKSEGKKVMGYGASTKGNVIIQYCGFTEDDLACIGEVNPDKFGAYTPHTHIPIRPEKEVFSMQPDYLLVLPWHFRTGIMEKEKHFLAQGGHFIFPLPKLEIV